jgi:hypothetical protein
MSRTHYKIKNALVAQARLEKDYAYEYKRTRITEWKLNENAINGITNIQEGKTISNQSFGKAHTQVQTMLSKIDMPVDFKYERGELADTDKVEKINAIKDKYRKIDRWDFKARLGDEQCIKYGVSVFLAYGQQNAKKEFEFINNLIDVNDFFIDPSVKIEDIETANYIGWWGVTKTKKDLEMLLTDPSYDASTIKEILTGGSQFNTETQQDIDKRNRQYSLGIAVNDNPVKGVYKFYNWITTHHSGDRYYLVFTESGQCIRCQKWDEIQHSNLYPIYNWAAYPEGFEFWSRSPMEVVRLNLEAQEKSLNDLMDNADKINNPQKLVNVDNLRNPGQVKWKRNGTVEITGNKNVNDVFQIVPTPVINTPIETYRMLDEITKEVSGVTNDVLGVSNTDTLGVYEGNVQQANDRFALMQQSRENAYYRLALLFREALKQHFTTKMAVKILGTTGLLYKNVSADEIKTDDNDFDIMITASNIEDKTNIEKSKMKIGTIDKYVQMQAINVKKAFELEGKIVGFTDDEIKDLLSQEEVSDEETQAVEQAFQDILKGREPMMYYEASDYYTTRLVEMMDEYQDYLRKKPELLKKLNAHQKDIQNIINEARANQMSNEQFASEMELPTDEQAAAENQSIMDSQGIQAAQMPQPVA